MALSQPLHAVHTAARVRMLKVRVTRELSSGWSGRLGLFLEGGVLFLSELHKEVNNLGHRGSRKLSRGILDTLGRVSSDGLVALVQASPISVGNTNSSLVSIQLIFGQLGAPTL